MGIVSWLFGGGVSALSGGVKTVAEVFRPNAEASAERDHEEFTAALAQFAAEFSHARQSLFGRVIDGINRLPRPALALGTPGLFVYAMVDPLGFAARMQGLALVPEPLWWLLGAIVSFYFGARELHYSRKAYAPVVSPEDVARTLSTINDIRGQEPKPPRVEPPASEPRVPLSNPALAEFLQTPG